MGKTSKRRPRKCSKQQYDDNYDKIYNRKEKLSCMTWILRKMRRR